MKTFRIPDEHSKTVAALPGVEEVTNKISDSDPIKEGDFIIVFANGDFSLAGWAYGVNEFGNWLTKRKIQLTSFSEDERFFRSPIGIWGGNPNKKGEMHIEMPFVPATIEDAERYCEEV